MDIFDVLTAILNRRIEFMDIGINENEALTKAEQDVSEKYHISPTDIKNLVGQIFNNTEIYKDNHSFS